MYHKKKLFLSLLLVCIHLNLLYSDDGMWMPHQMKDLNLTEQGLEMDPGNLYKSDGSGLMSGVVDLGGGTASFVSNKGLLFTNHHVAYGAIQRASTTEHNYLENGFLANSLEEEIQATGYTAGVLISYKEITTEIQKNLKKKMTALERYQTIDITKKKIIAETENGGPDLFAEIASMYSGNQYYIFIYKKIRDVRIVYAPPSDLGNFGGEIDNWMWPRHTCDFTFLRAYVSPEGVGVEYNSNNVPYEPKVYFKIAQDGIQEGDFSFIMGYPGKTYRNNSSPEFEYHIEKLHNSIEDRLEYIKFFENFTKDSKKIEIKYASKLKGLYNGLKNYRGKLEGFAKINLLENKLTHDEEFVDWARKKIFQKRKYGSVVEQINQFLENEYKPFTKKENQLQNLVGLRSGPTLLSQAHLVTRMVIEGQKPDMERDKYYQDRNHSKLKNYINFAERSYDSSVDKKYTILLINKLLSESNDNIPTFINILIKDYGTIEAWADYAFSTTKITTADYRLNLIDKKPEELKLLKDPLIDFAFQIETELEKIRDEKNIINQQLADLKKIYIKGLLEKNGSHFAPDANSTIRFTSGIIKGYSPRDGIYYKPITTLKGVIEKETGKTPFHVPEKLKQLHYNKDFGTYADKSLKDIPTCFLNTTNVTGGNSGSPTINSKGEITGIVFDMSYESVTCDYQVIPEFQRVINVDIRYILFITEKFSKANYIIDEIKM